MNPNILSLYDLKKSLLLLIVLLFGFHAGAQLYTFRNYTHRDGISMAKINAFAQSKDGYLWMGTDGAALVRFDGKTFKEIQFSNEQNNYHYNDLLIRNECIYIATAYSGYFRYSLKKNTIHRIDSPTIHKGEGEKIIVDKKAVFFLGRVGISRLLDGKEVLLKRFPKNAPIRYNQVIETPSGTFVNSNYGTFIIKDGQLTELSKHSKINGKIGSNTYQFGWYVSNKLVLFDSVFQNKMVIRFNDSGAFESVKMGKQAEIFGSGEYAVACDFNKILNQRVILTNIGEIYTEKMDSFTRIVHNFLSPINEPDDILIGQNGEFWLSSGYNGIFKVSIDPFTQIQLDPQFTSPDIGFPFVSSNDEIAMSLMSNGTYIGRISESSTFTFFDIRLYGSCEIKGSSYLASNQGIKKYINGASNPFESFLEDGKHITFVFGDGFDIWYGIAGEGLFRYNIVTLKKTRYGKNRIIADYIYTAQCTYDGDAIYFGTNNGIIRYDKTTKKFSKVAVNGLGSYSGVSAQDAFGNIWFTLDKGIVGIVDGKTKIIDVSTYSTSSVFYTLNADKYGNLIIGSNKGITILKLNAIGNVTSFQNYSGNTGFEGYETHMRSQFQIGNNIYVGTIEGLFVINTDILENLAPPLPPIITDLSSAGAQSSRTFHLHVNNPRVQSIYYRFRIVERDEKWISLAKNQTLQLHELPSGEYTLEVCASYDGIIFGKPSTQKIKIALPTWTSKWFLIGILLAILLLNILLLVYGKRFDSSRLLSTKDTEIHIQMAPTTLLFGAIVSPISHMLGNYFVPSLRTNYGPVFFLALVLLTLYFISLHAKKNGMQHLFKYLLTIGIYAIVLHFFWELYRSNLNPFHFMGIILAVSVAPFLLNRVVNTVIFGLVVFMLSVVCFALIQDPIYPKAHFLIGTFAAIGLLIMNTYLRYNSLEKLMFISDIINRGNFPVVAYQADGTITYVSENISQFADITHDKLLNNKISFLNTFVPFGDRYREHDATVEFEEGRKYLIPMSDAEQTIRWMEWSYKRFAENTRVIIGQDVSQRIELQNTYELLVQNVEDLIFTTDLNGNFTFVNQTFLQRTGYSNEEILGTNSIKIVRDDCLEEIDHFYREHFRQRKSTTYKELPIVTKSGETIWIGQHVNTIFAPGTKNHITGFISLARDVTEDHERKRLIEMQRDDITASINYAQKIQFNLLPSARLFEEHFGDHFIMFSPKDIVSGDFYWMRKINGLLVVGMGDCTGHGVPGAFMTLLGINMLNNVVLEARLTDPGLILTELDSRLEVYFGTASNQKMTDGMELTICVIDEKNDSISYACAGSRFLIHRDDDGFTMYKGNTEHIGDQKSRDFKGYFTQFADLTSNDTLYLLSDGFQDQFGGPKNKKYSFRRLLELLDANVNLCMEDQRMMIEEEFDNWMAIQPQTDDVTLLGLRRKAPNADKNNL